MAQCRSVYRDRCQSPSKSVMHQHTRKLQTVKVLVTTCGLHFELKHSRLSDEAETRRLVWSVQALGFTAELCMPVNLQTAKQATRASTSLRLGCCLRLSSLHPYCFTMAQLRLAARAQYCCSGHNMWFRSKPQVP